MVILDDYYCPRGCKIDHYLESLPPTCPSCFEHMLKPEQGSITRHIAYLQDPRVEDGVPQTGTCLWLILQLVKNGHEFPQRYLSFIKELSLDGHFEQVQAALQLLEELRESK